MWPSSKGPNIPGSASSKGSGNSSSQDEGTLKGAQNASGNDSLASKKSHPNQPSGSGKKNKATRSRLKALTPQDLDNGSNAVEIEDLVFQAAQAEERPVGTSSSSSVASLGEQRNDEQKIDSGFLRMPSDNQTLEDKVAGVWKNKVLGAKNPENEMYQSGQHPSVGMQASKAAQEMNEKMKVNQQHEAMINLVDTMFDCFQNLAYDFNQMAQGSDLELTWIRPCLSRENMGSWHQGANYISVFSGRISTRYWTLVVRGTHEGVLSYVIPSDKLLSFTSQPTSYLCYLELVPNYHNAYVSWLWSKHTLSEDDLVQVFRNLLDGLVQIAQEDLPPHRPLDLACVVEEARQPAPSQSATVSSTSNSAFGEELDYSARLRASLEPTNSANLSGFAHDLYSPSASGWNNANTPSPAAAANSGNFSTGSNATNSGSSTFSTASNGSVTFPTSQNINTSGGFSPVNFASQAPANTTPNSSTNASSTASSDEWKPMTNTRQGANTVYRLANLADATSQASTSTSSSSSTSACQSTSQPLPALPNVMPAAPAKEVPWNFMSSAEPTKASSVPSFAQPARPVNPALQAGFEQANLQNIQAPAPAKSGFDLLGGPGSANDWSNSKVDQLAYDIAQGISNEFMTTVPVHADVQSAGAFIPTPVLPQETEVKETLVQPEHEDTPLPVVEPVSSGQAVAVEDYSCLQLIELLIKRFDQEMELVAGKGSEAFARRDLKGAEHLVRLAEFISEQNDALQRFKDAHAKDLS
jgi:hypothetical protein